MAKAKITVEQANHLAVQFGFFDGLHKMIQDYDVSMPTIRTCSISASTTVPGASARGDACGNAID